MCGFEAGGGASTTTQPAVGTSSATDVSLRDYLAGLRNADERFLAERDRRLTELRQADQVAIEKAESAAREALLTAKGEANERLASHNGLIDKMEAQQATYALRETTEQRFSRLEQWQAKLTGGMILLAAIGLANLLKLWLA